MSEKGAKELVGVGVALEMIETGKKMMGEAATLLLCNTSKSDLCLSLSENRFDMILSVWGQHHMTTDEQVECALRIRKFKKANVIIKIRKW